MTPQRNQVAADTITATFPMSFAGADTGDQITATLSYNVYEPFAVNAAFALADSPAVQWVLARELLRDGIALPTGLGDIKIYPTADGLLIELYSPSGRAVLVAPTAPVVAFVQAIYTAVPEDREAEFFSIEAELDRLADLHNGRELGSGA
jgi:Streptomyces sporulation and cell division protein, SsgA